MTLMELKRLFPLLSLSNREIPINDCFGVQVFVFST